MNVFKPIYLILFGTIVGISLGSAVLAQTTPHDKKPVGVVVIRGSIERPGKIRTHRLKMLVNHNYEITFAPKNSSIMSTVKVTDDKGNVLARGDGKGKMSVQCCPRKDDVYNVTVVGQADDDPVGMYSVTIRTRIDAVMTPVFMIRGTVTKNGPKLKDGRLYRVYNVYLHAGRHYTIEMNGDFDTYLYLKDSSGRRLGSDDDGGPGSNSKLTYRPTVDGVYRIYASAFSSRHSGMFTLTVNVR